MLVLTPVGWDIQSLATVQRLNTLFSAWGSFGLGGGHYLRNLWKGLYLAAKRFSKSAEGDFLAGRILSGILQLGWDLRGSVPSWQGLWGGYWTTLGCSSHLVAGLLHHVYKSGGYSTPITR